MKKFIIGLITGLVLGGALVWASTHVSLEDRRGNEIGITSNPVVVSIQ